MKYYSFGIILSAFVILFFAILSNGKSESLRIDETVYPTIEEAAAKGEFGEIDIYQIEHVTEDLIGILFSIDQTYLYSELLYKELDGYRVVLDSQLAIFGMPISQSDHKIRTFQITAGPWHQSNMPYTYVTMGVIAEPEDVTSVEIRYRNLFKKISITNNSFLHVTSSSEKWEELHPVIFFNNIGEEVGGSMRGFWDKDLYCH